MNRHSRLHGNNAQAAQGRVLRGQRAYCSNRGQRDGCGRSFPIFLATILPLHTVTATLLWPVLLQWLSSFSIKAAAETLKWPLALETLYHLLQRLRRRLDAVRTALNQRGPPPASVQINPLLQTVEHLRSAFPSATNALAEFQCHFQRPLMG